MKVNFTEQHLSVTHLDGKTEEVVLRRLPIASFYQWCHALGELKIPLMAALACGKSMDWINDLEDADVGRLSTAAFKVNFPRAVSLANEDHLIAAQILPILDLVQTRLPALASLGIDLTASLPPLPPRDAAEVTPSPSSEISTSTSSSAGSPPTNVTA